MTDIPTGSAGDEARTWAALWLSDPDVALLLDALSVAAAHTDPPCAAAGADACCDLQHAAAHTRAAAWRGLALRLRAITPTDPPVHLRLDEDAARTWLLDAAADEFSIDDTFNTHDLTIVPRLEELLYRLGHHQHTDVLDVRPPLSSVQIWPTADAEGIDGGTIITIDLAVGDRPIRLATRHQGFDDFTAESATSGIDAAIESLRHVVDLVNAEIRHHLYTTARALPTAFTVVGVWRDDEPIPVGVIAGDHEVVDGDGAAFEQGLWATGVTAPDPATAQAWAVAEMRHANP
jgi:hypothetical protein